MKHVLMIVALGLSYGAHASEPKPLPNVRDLAPKVLALAKRLPEAKSSNDVDFFLHPTDDKRIIANTFHNGGAAPPSGSEPQLFTTSDGGRTWKALARLSNVKGLTAQTAYAHAFWEEGAQTKGIIEWAGFCSGAGPSMVPYGHICDRRSSGDGGASFVKDEAAFAGRFQPTAIPPQARMWTALRAARAP